MKFNLKVIAKDEANHQIITKHLQDVVHKDVKVGTWGSSKAWVLKKGTSTSIHLVYVVQSKILTLKLEKKSTL